MPNRLRRFFTPPIFADEEKTRTAQILNAFIWNAIGILLVAILLRAIFWTENGFQPLLILLAVVFVLGAGQILIRRGHVRGTSVFLICALWFAMTYQVWEADGLRDVAVIAYIVIIVFSSLLLGWRVALAVNGLSLAVVWYFAVMEKEGERIFHVDTPFNYARDVSLVFILVGILIYLLISNWTRTLNLFKLELQERLRVEEKLQRQADYLTAINEISLGLLNRLELHSLLESILSRACRLIETEHGLIELVLPDSSALRQEVGQGGFKKYVGSPTLKSEGIVGTVWDSGETLIVADYANWEKKLPEGIEAGLTAVMGVPLTVGNTVIGVLVVAYAEAGRAFSHEKVVMLERFASLASLAIDNARLHETAQKELQERRNTESALRASEERFRKVFENRYIAIAIVTLAEGTFLEANQAFWELSGFTPQQALGHTSLELNTWENPQDRARFVRELREKRSLQNVQVDFKRTNKTSIAFYELLDILDQLCILCMFYDVSEQRQIERALQENEERMRAILAAIPDMIFELSQDGVFLDFIASTELEPILPPEEFIGKNVREILPPAIVAQTLFALERALETGQLHAFEYGLPPGEETQFFEARISAMTTNSAVMMVRDISQRKWVEKEREKLINELEGKNSELERFTYTVSHDLKSPLITIKGFLGFLERDAASGNIVRLRADIQRIASATDKMQMLLNELLDLTRIGRLVNPSQTIDFREIAHEAVELVHGRIQSRGVRVSIQENLPTVFGDRRRLVEILQNLVDNAVKFMGEQSDPCIEIGLGGYENGQPIFYIRDNGIGIDVSHHDRIFGLFNKLDTESDGTGIGLALVKRIIEVHDGRIWVESEPGNGATFLFTLPAKPAT